MSCSRGWRCEKFPVRQQLDDEGLLPTRCQNSADKHINMYSKSRNLNLVTFVDPKPSTTVDAAFFSTPIPSQQLYYTAAVCLHHAPTTTTQKGFLMMGVLSKVQPVQHVWATFWWGCLGFRQQGLIFAAYKHFAGLLSGSARFVLAFRLGSLSLRFKTRDPQGLLGAGGKGLNMEFNAKSYCKVCKLWDVCGVSICACQVLRQQIEPKLGFYDIDMQNWSKWVDLLKFCIFGKVSIFVKLSKIRTTRALFES